MTLAIHRGRRQRPRRIFLYGTHGLGKSTWAAMSEKPIFLPTEDGLGDIDCESFDLCTSLAAVQHCIESLLREQHDYSTVVIDSADWLERLIHAEICRARGVRSIADIDFQRGYTYALIPWREILTALDMLRDERGMSAILLAHTEVSRYNNPAGDSYDRYVPRLHKGASHMVQEWADEVFFANYRVFTTSADEGFGKKKAKGVGAGERVLYTTERPSHVAKNRLGLPDELPLDYREFAAARDRTFTPAEA